MNLVYEKIVDVAMLYAKLTDKGVRDLVTRVSHPHVHAEVKGDPPVAQLQLDVDDTATDDQKKKIDEAVKETSGFSTYPDSKGGVDVKEHTFFNYVCPVIPPPTIEKRKL